MSSQLVTAPSNVQKDAPFQRGQSVGKDKPPTGRDSKVKIKSSWDKKGKDEGKSSKSKDKGNKQEESQGGMPGGKVGKCMSKNQWNLIHLGAFLDWPAKYVPYLVKKSSFNPERPQLKNRDAVNLRDKNARTSLHIAAKQDNYRFIRGLTEEKNLDVNAVDEKGMTPMHYACQEGHHRVVSALIYHKADTNIRSKDGQRTPLQVALSSGHANIARILYYHGKANINVTTNKKRTVLHLCAQFADAPDLLEAFIAARKLDINTPDKYGNTPLHYAVKCGSLEMVKSLVEAGAIVKTKNNAGMSSLHIAIYSGYFGIVEYLVKSGGASPKLLTGILVSILTSKDKAFYHEVILYIKTCLDRYIIKGKSIKWRN